ncbi:hypothetical protein ACXR2U_17210, partial [Jatrophihabitans sp. YIM 134969]
MIDERTLTARGPDIGVLAAWVTAWLRGTAAGDDLLAAIPGVRAHRVTGDTRDVGEAAFTEVLLAWRRRGATGVRVVLPVPGDVRGLPADNPAFTAAALDAGQALVGGGLGLVPEAVGSGQLLLWHAFEVGEAGPDPLTVREAQVELGAAMRETAGIFTRESLAAGADPAALAGARRAGDQVELPPGHPGPAVALLAQARRLRAVL